MHIQFGKITLIFIGIMLFSIVSYFVGAFVFMWFPTKVIEPFVITYPILSFFGKLFIGWIICGMLYLSQDVW